MRVYTAFMIEGCIKKPVTNPQKTLADVILEVEGKIANTQAKKDEFQERGVYFEVGYADVDLDDIEKIKLEQLAGKCNKLLVAFTHSGYFSKYPAWRWISP